MFRDYRLVVCSLRSVAEDHEPTRTTRDHSSEGPDERPEVLLRCETSHTEHHGNLLRTEPRMVERLRHQLSEFGGHDRVVYDLDQVG